MPRRDRGRAADRAQRAAAHSVAGPRAVRLPEAAISPPLVWHILLLAYAAGLTAAAAPWPGAVGAALVWCLSRTLLPSRLSHLLYVFCFCAGVFAASAALPRPPAADPAWTLSREVVEVRGVVRRVEGAPDRSLRLILRDVRRVDGAGAEDGTGAPDEMDAPDGTGAGAPGVVPEGATGGGTGEPLPGGLVWTWRHPLYRPAPGQEVRVALRVKPVRGFANPGTWDSADYWALRGVFYRAFSNGGRVHPHWGSRPASALWDAREALRAAVVHGLGGPAENDAAASKVAGSGGTENDKGAPESGGALESGEALGRGAAVVVALLFGDRFFLDRDEMLRMGHASLAHTLALSGLHLGMVVGLGALAAWAVGWLWPGVYLRVARRRLAVLAAAPLALGYVWLGQGAPSLVRAAVMFAAWGALLLAGRSQVLLDGLFAALAAILLADPLAALDSGLRMSAAAVAGIALLGPAWARLKPWFDRARERDAGRAVKRGAAARLAARTGQWAVGLLLVSLAAQFALLPLAAWNFGYVSLAFWINLLWLPVLGLAIMPLAVAGFLAAAASFVAPGFGPALGGLAAWLLGAAAGVQDALFGLLAHLEAAGLAPWCAVLRPHWAAGLGYWGLLVLLAASFAGRGAGPYGSSGSGSAGSGPSGSGSGKAFPASTSLTAPVPAGSARPAPPAFRASQASRIRPSRSAPRAGAALLCLVLLAAPSLAALWPWATPWATGGGVRLTLLDVGQGQAVLLEGPDGARVLLDGGGLWPGFDVGAAVTGPALAWNRPPRLDGVLLSHPDSDHWRGLEYVLRRFSVGWFASNGDRPRGEDGERYDEALAEWGGEPRVLTAGEVLPLGGGAALEVLHPAPGFAGKDNDRSLVLRLTWRGRGLALLPGDVERAGLLALLASGRDLRADVLVLPHHGAASSLSPELYRRAAPRLALASAGFLNYFGFPAALVTEALRAAGVPLRTTADAGALTVEWCAPDAAPRLGAARPVAVAAGP